MNECSFVVYCSYCCRCQYPADLIATSSLVCVFTVAFNLLINACSKFSTRQGDATFLPGEYENFYASQHINRHRAIEFGGLSFYLIYCWSFIFWIHKRAYSSYLIKTSGIGWETTMLPCVWKHWNMYLLSFSTGIDDWWLPMYRYWWSAYIIYMGIPLLSWQK